MRVGLFGAGQDGAGLGSEVQGRAGQEGQGIVGLGRERQGAAGYTHTP